MSSDMSQSPMQDFYSGKTVLVTGGTGFLGKVLVEKLLRSCPDVQKIYLLVRVKKKESSEDRLKKLIDHQAFAKLKHANPGFAEKLGVVHGDLHRPGLGLDERDEMLLTQTVNIIIHSAATLKFDEKLKLAVQTNIKGTQELCLLAQHMANLQAFVYVSTAYSNCDKDWIPERVCPPPVRSENLISLTELLDEETLDSITPSLLATKPNTYIFTKCAAEEVVNSFKSSIPVAILRPAIVLAAAREPEVGWLTDIQGPTGAVFAMYKGVLRTVVCDPQYRTHLVPVDYTANCILALAHSVASQRRTLTENGQPIPVVNFVPKADNCITWNQLIEYSMYNIRCYPSQSAVWYPFTAITLHPLVTSLYQRLLHHWPACLMDLASTIIGRPPKMRKTYKRIDRYFKNMNYFGFRQFNFEEKNAALLWESLEPRDQQLFPFNMADINWQSYFRDYVQGCRHYLLGESPASIPRSRTRLKRLYLLHILTQNCSLMLILMLILKMMRRRVGYSLKVTLVVANLVYFLTCLTRY